YKNAKGAFDEALEKGLSEDEAFKEAALAMGATKEESDVAEAAYQQALAEGVDPREAVYRAENAVRDEFDRNNKDYLSQAAINTTSSEISEAIYSGASQEDALRQKISSPDVSRRDVDVVEQAAYLALDNAYQSNDPKGLSFLFSARREGSNP
ncbi:hypothetical protein OAS67_08160, partial [Alphaproteobacteria bacterium]|nr:hypothetical protein [Alphaproteobacteria bacterium]